MKILIVDDSRAMQTIVRRGIEQLGYDNLELRKADNGKEALDIIRTWEPELVLSDWHMPEMTGIELLTSLNRQMLGVTIGFVTTETSDERIQEAMDAGAQFVVQKPFDFKTLHNAVLPILQGSSDGEKTLTNSDTEKNISEHIVLPSLDELSEILNKKSQSRIQCINVNPMVLNKKQYPYLLGLYSDAKQKAVHAIAIADLNGACILGAAMGGVSEESIHIALAEKAMPKKIIDNCRQLLTITETTLLNGKHNTHLSLRSANLLHKPNPSVEKLLQKGANDRLDVAMKMPGLDTGRITLIVS